MSNNHSNYQFQKANRLANFALGLAGLLIAGSISLLVYYFEHY